MTVNVTVKDGKRTSNFRSRCTSEVHYYRRLPGVRVVDRGGNSGSEATVDIDGRPGIPVTNDANGDPIYYNNPEDIFEGQDPRFFATIMYPNCPWQ
jgi:hypothetical protein